MSTVEALSVPADERYGQAQAIGLAQAEAQQLAQQQELARMNDPNAKRLPAHDVTGLVKAQRWSSASSRSVAHCTGCAQSVLAQRAPSVHAKTKGCGTSATL